MAYVFGFRKREQGQNAVEIPQYDQLIVEEEQAIALLRKLDGTSVQSKPATTDSRYATFTKQPTPQFTVAENLFPKKETENIIYDKACDANTLPHDDSNKIPAKKINSNNTSNFMVSVWFYIDNWGNEIGNENHEIWILNSNFCSL